MSLDRLAAPSSDFYSPAPNLVQNGRKTEEFSKYRHANVSFGNIGIFWIMTKSQIAVRIPPSLLAELNRYVEETGTSKTEEVVSAIAQYIGCNETVPLMQRMAELELRMKELTALVKSGSSLREVEE